MDKLENTVQIESHEECDELVEMGAASELTQGMFFGLYFDVGSASGWRFH